MRPLVFVILVAIAVLLVWLVAEMTEDSVESDSVRVVATWGSEKPDYIVTADMFTTTTTARARTAPTERRTMRAASAAPPVVVAGDPPDSDFDRLAGCESGGRWDANTGNGYYGGLQFDAQTWRANGGTGLPHQHSRETQIEVARRLWRARGWQPWPVCSRRVGLR